MYKNSLKHISLNPSIPSISQSPTTFQSRSYSSGPPQYFINRSWSAVTLSTQCCPSRSLASGLQVLYYAETERRDGGLQSEFTSSQSKTSTWGVAIEAHVHFRSRQKNYFNNCNGGKIYLTYNLLYWSFWSIRFRVRMFNHYHCLSL